MEQPILFTLIGPASDAVMLTIAEYCAEAKVQIKYLQHRQDLGFDCVMGQINGTWNAMAKLEQKFQLFAKQHELILDWQRVEAKQLDSNQIPYTVYITAAAKPDNFKKIWQHFTDSGLVIIDFVITENTATLTRAVVHQFELIILIPLDLSLSNLREEFLVFCDEQNFDAMLEPVR